VRPNRPSLRGAYGLFDQHLRRGGSEYRFGLNAVQSTPAGSDLVFTFRAGGGRGGGGRRGRRVDGPSGSDVSSGPGPSRRSAQQE
jgi:hypothetical protein